MYCSTCGTATAEFSYCKHCGAKLIREDGADTSSELKPGSLIFGMLATFVFGLVAITMLAGVMKVILGLDSMQIMGLMLFPFSLMIVMEAVFIRLLLRQTQNRQITHGAELGRAQGTNELDEARAHALPEARPSVTEHTTRAFEPVIRNKA